MSDMNDRLRDRWNERRKKAYNWKKLIILALILVALLVLMHRLNKATETEREQQVEVIDSTSATGEAPLIPDSTENSSQPGSPAE